MVNEVLKRRRFDAMPPGLVFGKPDDRLREAIHSFFVLGHASLRSQ
jgi:hypothetical protein